MRRYGGDFVNGKDRQTDRHRISTMYRDPIGSNKNHHKMMILDPMFMIVYHLRLFLTAVTRTAVTPTAIIL